MKIWKQIGMLLSVLLLSACTAEDTNDLSGIPEDASTLITVSMDDLLAVNMNTRSGSVDELLAEMKDLNIRVYQNVGTGYISMYCKGTSISVDGQSVNSTKTYYINGSDWNTEVRIHSNDISAKSITKVEVIANWGSDLQGVTDWSTLKEEGDAKLQDGYCVMYGEATTSSLNDHDNSTGALDCSKFEVKLKRTRAMLSVKIESNNANPLKEGVTITPTKVSLKNVPTSCYITHENKITASESTSMEYGLTDLGWNGFVSKENSVGIHAEKGASGKPDDFHPIYLFENKQGQISNSDQIKKWPEGCNNVTDVKANQTHSYIEIEADYKYEEQGQVKNSGTIVYRFFLGENIVNDFNVTRNTYYRLTLQLSGFGGAKEDGNVDSDGKLIVNEEDVSWRVDLSIRDWGFEKNAYDFDAHDMMVSIPVIGSGWTIKSVTGGDSYASWIEFQTPSSGTEWMSPTTIAGYEVKANEGALIMHIQALYYSHNSIDPAGAFDDKTPKDAYREMVINLANGSDTQTVTIRQYVPIALTVGNETYYMERFEEKNLLPWNWMNDNLSSFKEVNYQQKTFSYGDDLSKANLNKNTLYLAIDKNSAAYYCIDKGNGEGSQNTPADYYVLPDKVIMEAMLNYQHDPANGPFEPVRRYEDYWTSSVRTDAKTATVYWNGTTGLFETTTDRNSVKRVRSVYTFDYNY